ncbi:hypothetical protein BRN98_08105, partial [Xanthomonas oryzae pv. oryzae]
MVKGLAASALAAP